MEDKVKIYSIVIEVRDINDNALYFREDTVLDVNDNAPEIVVTSLSSSILENSPRGALIALLNVNDQDSRENGQVTSFI